MLGRGVVVVGVEQHRVQAGGPGGRHVDEHGVADVGDAMGGQAERVQGGREDAGDPAWPRPTTWESTTHRTGAPAPSPTWQTAMRRSTPSIWPEAFDTTPMGTPRAWSSASAGTEEAIG